jgi:hypothetical protein
MNDGTKRQQRNQELIARMKAGEALTHRHNPFPKRKLITKDSEAISQLYCHEEHTWVSGRCSVCGETKTLQSID